MLWIYTASAGASRSRKQSQTPSPEAHGIERRDRRAFKINLSKLDSLGGKDFNRTRIAIYEAGLRDFETRCAVLDLAVEVALCVRSLRDVAESGSEDSRNLSGGTRQNLQSLCVPNAILLRAVLRHKPVFASMPRTIAAAFCNRRS